MTHSCGFTLSVHQEELLGWHSGSETLSASQSCLNLWTTVPVSHFDNLISVQLHYLNWSWDIYIYFFLLVWNDVLRVFNSNAAFNSLRFAPFPEGQLRQSSNTRKSAKNLPRHNVWSCMFKWPCSTCHNVWSQLHNIPTGDFFILNFSKIRLLIWQRSGNTYSGHQFEGILF